MLLVAALLGAFFYSQQRLSEQRPGAEIKAAVIQGNVRQDLKWEPAQRRQVFDIYKGLSRKAKAEGAELIVWPETATPFFYGDDLAMTNELRQFNMSLGTHLLFGSVTAKKQKPD